MPIQTNANPSSRVTRGFHGSRAEADGSLDARGFALGRSSHHTIIISVMCGLFRVEFWKDIAADLLRLVGGPSARGS